MAVRALCPTHGFKPEDGCCLERTDCKQCHAPMTHGEEGELCFICDWYEKEILGVPTVDLGGPSNPSQVPSLVLLTEYEFWALWDECGRANGPVV